MKVFGNKYAGTPARRTDGFIFLRANEAADFYLCAGAIKIHRFMHREHSECTESALAAPASYGGY